MGYARTLITLLVLVALAMGTAAHAAPPPQQLIVNGDFENATISPWYAFDGPSTLADQTYWTAASGTHSIELSNSGGIAQDVPTMAGTRYDLSFAFAGDPGCTQGLRHLTVAWNGTLAGAGGGSATFTFDTTGHSTASMGWQTVHVLVDASSSTTQLRFIDPIDSGCGIAIDSVGMVAASGTRTGTQLTAPTSSIVVGDSVTFTATVLGATSAVTPTGTIQFELDGVAVGAPVALSGGQAQTTFDGLARGTYEVSALYTPDSGSFAASSVTQRYSVLPDSTSTALVVDNPSVNLGDEVTLTANVDVVAPGNAPLSGTVQFGDEGGPVGDPVPVDPDGVAQVALTETAGAHYLYAAYSGTDDSLSSWGYADVTVVDTTPPPTTDPVSKLGSKVTLVTSKSPVAPGEPYTVTATVAPGVPSNLVPTGAVSFTVGSLAFGDPLPLDGNQSASITITPPTGVTSQAVRARYSGDANFLRSVALLAETIVTPAGAAPPPAPEDTQAPAYTLDLTPARLKVALAKGIKARASCNENCSVVVELALNARSVKALGMKARGTRLVVGRASYDFLDHRTSDLVIRFSKRYRKALAKARRVQLRLTATATDMAGNDAVLARNVTLKR